MPGFDSESENFEQIVTEAFNKSEESLAGAVFAASAFLIWGISPIYWKELQSVPALELVTHRVLWSPLFLLPVFFLQKRGTELTAIFRNPKNILTLLLTTTLISVNWLTFIWAVNNGHVLESSLGYYITPLINTFLGMVFLRERLRRLQVAALVLAGAGVGYLALDFGSVPWIALLLACTFALYGLIHKVMAVSSTTGLTLEMILLFGPAAAYIGYLHQTGAGAFLHSGLRTDLLLVATTIFTAFPLLLFSLGTRRLHMSTVGFFQYIAPSCYFLLGVFFFHEPVSTAQIATFCLIWLALVCYSTDSVFYYRLFVRRSSRMGSG